jgi:hypothetical protein
MSVGGQRQGAGRKPGSVNLINKEARERAAASGLLPLDYLLSIMRDDLQPQEARIDAAKAAAPYVHAKLQAVTVTGKDGGPIQLQRVERVIVDPKG